MSYCSQCGAKLGSGVRFCPACGVAVNTAGLKCKGVGIRFLAQLFDWIVIAIFGWFTGHAIASLTGGLTNGGWELEGGPAMLFFLLLAVFSVLYFTILEAVWNGQSLGKKIVRIRVVNEDGTDISLSTSFLRNVLRLVDGLLFYLVGAIFIWLSDKNQRLGDRMAHTCVVKKIDDSAAKPREDEVFVGE